MQANLENVLNSSNWSWTTNRERSKMPFKILNAKEKAQRLARRAEHRACFLTPCWREPALMRWIHRPRMSRFLVRRSLYAYCSAFSTRSRAARMQFLLRPRKPLASCKIFWLFMFLSACPPSLPGSSYCQIHRGRRNPSEITAFTLQLSANKRSSFLPKSAPAHCEQAIHIYTLTRPRP